MTRHYPEKLLLLLILILIPVFYAILPLFGPRFLPTHDGEYHIIRFHEFYTMLQAGNWFPRWAPGLNSGYGVPIFNFHYPFPNYIGSLFHLIGASFVDSFKLTEALAYISAIISCFFWLKKLFTPRAAVVGTILSAFTPYWFVDLYIRGSVGEVWAVTWFFVLLAAVEHRNRWAYMISLGLLVISHNILTLVFFPLTLLYMYTRKRLWIMPSAVGICLAAYFWLPALIERGYVIGLNTVNYRDHFPEFIQLLIPSWGSGFSQEGTPYGEMSFQIGVMPFVAIIMSAWLSKSEKNRDYRLLLGGSVFLFTLIVFLMLRISIPIWDLIPVMQYLQYPWRLLSVIIPLTALSGAYIAYRYQTHTVILVLFTVLSAVFVWRYIRPVTYEPRTDAHYLTRREFTDGTSSMGNSFSTRWLPWVKDRAARKSEIIRGDAEISGEAVRPLGYSADILASSESTIRINTAYYPGWTVMVDGKAAPIDYSDGLLNISVAPGNHRITVAFRETPLRWFSDALSVLGLFWLTALFILNWYDRGNRHISDR